jgi:hypothetical protein
VIAAFARPHSWLWLLTFHIAFALLLVGAALTVAVVSVAALRQADAPLVVDLRRIALRTNLFLTLPAFVGVHIFGMILADREYPSGTKSPGWLDAGFSITDAFGVFGIIVLSLLQWWVLRRARAGQLRGWQAQLTSWLSPATILLLLVVLFVMAGKPGQ